MRVRRAAKPQTGGIRHQNDCLVETSNFSFLSARGCERAASLLWPVVPLFRPLGGRCDRRVRKRGPRTPGSPGTVTPGKHWGGANDRGSWWKSSWRLFPQGPSVSWSPWQPRSPVEQQAGGPGTFAHFCGAFRGPRGASARGPWLSGAPSEGATRQGLEKKTTKKTPPHLLFLFFFSFFSRRENSRFSGNLCLGSSGVEQKSPHSGFRAMSAGSRAQAGARHAHRSAHPARLSRGLGTPGVVRPQRNYSPPPFPTEVSHLGPSDPFACLE